MALPFHRRKTRLGVVLLAGLLASGCMGANGGYFETVKQDIESGAETAPTADSGEIVTAEVDPLALMSPQTTAPAGEERVGDLPITGQSQQTAAGPLLPTGQPAGATAPLNTLYQDKPAAVGDTAFNAADPAAALAPAAPAAPAGQQIAGVIPNALLGTAERGDNFALGVESPVPVDPLEAAAEQQIFMLDAGIDHGQCKGGWGPKPKRISAQRIQPGDPYYIEIRMRHTPMLPVGHTYVAYGKLDAYGEPIDEKLIMLAPVGGYAGAALASGIPMPGILKPHPDDCRIRPAAAYRISLNAQKYEQLLRAVAKAKHKKPKYLLFTYNCNHFMSRIAKSVGLKPPKNIYVPALEYIFAMIEANEGRKVARW